MATLSCRSPIRPNPSRTRLRLVRATYFAGEHNRLIRRWHTLDAYKVPPQAHARHDLTRDGRLRLVGYDELMCAHEGDRSECIARAEATRTAAARRARRKARA